MRRIPLDRSLLCDVFIDESSQTKHRFLTMGGLIIPNDRSDDFDAAVFSARGGDLPNGEMAWTKVSKSKIHAYKRVVTAVMRPDVLRSLNPLHFHMLVVDTSKLNDRKYNNGLRDTGFNKEIYQLGMKFRRLYPGKLFHLYLDRRNTKNLPEELRSILNFGAKKAGDPRDWPFRRVHFRDSEKCQKMQVVDVLLGAVSFHLNGHRTAIGASPAKCELSDYVLTIAEIRNVTSDTPMSGRFTLWHRQLKPR